MAEDLEVGVLLKPKNSLEDEVQDQEVAVDGQGGGDLTPGQREQQEGVIAGGVSRGLAGAAVIGGILSQLKTITGAVKAVFGIISRALVPVIEQIADIIRPLASAANEFAQNPVQTITGSPPGITEQARENPVETAALGNLGITTVGGTAGLDAGRTIIEGASNFLNFGGPQSADQTGEAQKQRFKQNLDEAQRDKTGSFR